MSKFNQNVIISRVNARGCIYESIGTPDRYKIVKTNADGVIDASLLSSSTHWDRVFYIPTTEYALVNNYSAFQNNAVIVEDILEDNILTKKITGPTVDWGLTTPSYAKYLIQFCIDISGVSFTSVNPLTLTTRASLGTGCTLNIEVYKNNTFLNSVLVDPVPLVDTVITVPRLEPPTVFANGDYLSIILLAKPEALSRSIYIKNLKVSLMPEELP